MKRAICLIVSLVLLLPLGVPLLALAESPVPDAVPEDLGGKTLYGYLVDLKTQYLAAKVFQDAAAYTDQDRENARRAIRLIIDATTQKMDQTGQPDQYFLYLRAYAYELQFQDEKTPDLQQLAMDDYAKTVELGGSYAQADYDRVAAMEVQAAPLAWQMPQMLTLDEIGQILGIAEGDLCYADIAYQLRGEGQLGVGYALRSAADPIESAIFVLAEPLGGRARYDLMKRATFLGKAEEVSGIGDEAVLVGIRNRDNDPLLYSTILVLKDELVLQVRVPDHAWRRGANMDPAELAKVIAAKVIANIYDAGRAVPDMVGLALENVITPLALASGEADSPVPDEVPADLGGKTVYGYVVELRQQYLPEDAFIRPDSGDADKNNARRAAKLLIETITEGFDANGQNAYELEIRGYCYALIYDDTGDVAYRQLAINDYKQAMYLGFAMAKPGYDKLAAPILSSMAELKNGASGEDVRLMQAWLIQAGYLSGQADGKFGNGTEKAIKAFEEDNALTSDGIADIAFLLSLYAKIDDGDVLYLK